MMNQMVTMVGPMSHGPGTFPIDDRIRRKCGYPQDMWMNLDAQVRPKAETPRAAQRMGRGHDGHDDARARAASGPVRRDYSEEGER
jgi:hypothetical protein